MFRHTMLRTVSTAALVLGLGTAGALAADIMDPVAPAPAYAPEPVPGWGGFYFGVHAGYGMADLDLSYNSDASESAAAYVEDNEGALAGVHAGYNWQTGQIVFGIEGDIDWSAMETEAVEVSTDAFVGDIDFLASLRARLGFDIGGRTLPYITGGLAYIESEQTIHAGTAASGQEEIEHEWGGIIGAGVEHKLTNTFSVRGEVLYAFFGDEDWICRTSCGGSEGDDVGDLDLDVFTFRVGVSAHF